MGRWAARGARRLLERALALARQGADDATAVATLRAAAHGRRAAAAAALELLPDTAYYPVLVARPWLAAVAHDAPVRPLEPRERELVAAQRKLEALPEEEAFRRVAAAVPGLADLVAELRTARAEAMAAAPPDLPLLRWTRTLPGLGGRQQAADAGRAVDLMRRVDALFAAAGPDADPVHAGPVGARVARAHVLAVARLSRR